MTNRATSIRYALRAIVILLALTILFDYWHYQRTYRAFRETAAQLGGKSYSLGDWPLGHEGYILFQQVPTLGELRALGERASHCRNLSMSVYVPSPVAEDEMAQLRSAAQPLGVQVNEPRRP